MPIIIHRDIPCIYNSLIAPKLNEEDREYLIRNMCDMYLDEIPARHVNGGYFDGMIRNKGYHVLGSLASGIQFDVELEILEHEKDRMSVLVERIDPTFANRN